MGLTTNNGRQGHRRQESSRCDVGRPEVSPFSQGSVTSTHSRNLGWQAVWVCGGRGRPEASPRLLSADQLAAIIYAAKITASLLFGSEKHLCVVAASVMMMMMMTSAPYFTQHCPHGVGTYHHKCQLHYSNSGVYTGLHRI